MKQALPFSFDHGESSFLFSVCFYSDEGVALPRNPQDHAPIQIAMALFGALALKLRLLTVWTKAFSGNVRQSGLGVWEACVDLPCRQNKPVRIKALGAGLFAYRSTRWMRRQPEKSLSAIGQRLRDSSLRQAQDRLLPLRYLSVERKAGFSE
jgi:hypothetical protein